MLSSHGASSQCGKPNTGHGGRASILCTNSTTTPRCSGPSCWHGRRGMSPSSTLPRAASKECDVSQLSFSLVPSHLLFTFSFLLVPSPLLLFSVSSHLSLLPSQLENLVVVVPLHKDGLLRR